MRKTEDSSSKEDFNTVYNFSSFWQITIADMNDINKNHKTYFFLLYYMKIHGFIEEIFVKNGKKNSLSNSFISTTMFFFLQKLFAKK